jgi:CRISPR-associated protein Csm4
VGLEATRTYIPADTLFSALCMAWRELYGAEDLSGQLLDRFTAGQAPFFLTSAFPLAAGVRFYPRPLLQGLVRPAEGEEKSFKGVKFLSEGIFVRLIAGETLTFRRENTINGGAAWTTPDERKRLEPWTDDEAGDIVLWRTAVVPRVTLDRITSASEIWHFGETALAPGAGLWFGVELSLAREDEPVRRLEASLRLLGDHGLGGERSAGHGLFVTARAEPLTLPDVPGANHFITLAPVCPGHAAEAAALTGKLAAYDLLPRRGWVTSLEGGSLRRRTVWMFGDGSLLTGTGQPRPGRLADVTPDALTAHRVYRYGLGFPVGVKL